jgi:hypothetical protein
VEGKDEDADDDECLDAWSIEGDIGMEIGDRPFEESVDREEDDVVAGKASIGEFAGDSSSREVAGNSSSGEVGRDSIKEKGDVSREASSGDV